MSDTQFLAIVVLTTGHYIVLAGLIVAAKNSIIKAITAILTEGGEG